MKKIISLLFAAVLCVAGLNAYSGEEDGYDFFGYNTWYHKADSKNYSGRSSFDNGRYKILSRYGGDAPIYYLSVDDQIIYCPFDFTILKRGNSYIRILTGEDAVCYSVFEFDIRKGNTSILLKGDEDGDVVSKIAVKRTPSKMTLSYQLRKFDHRLDDDFCERRVGDGWVVNVVDEFVDKDRDFLNYVIVENMYNYCFKSLGKFWSVEETKELISHFDITEMRILRNLLYAMHGYSFKSADLSKLFNQFDWYSEEITDSLQIEFSEAEQEILEYIMEIEKRGP